MLPRSPKSEIIQQGFIAITKTLDKLWENAKENKTEIGEAVSGLALTKGFLDSLASSGSSTVGRERNQNNYYKIIAKNITAMMNVLTGDTAKEDVTLAKKLLLCIAAIKFSLPLYVTDVQAECDKSNKKETNEAPPKLPPSQFSGAPNKQFSFPPQPDFSLQSQGIRHSRPVSTLIGNLDTYLRKLHNMKFDKQYPYMLDQLPEPTLQIGWTCCYKGIKFIFDCWNKQNRTYPTMPYLLTGPEKKSVTSLRSLGKKKAKEGVVGLAGIGAVYDVNLIPEFLGETDYHGQIVSFNTKDDLRDVITKSLELKCPLLLPVDWVDGGSIGKDNGKHAHYVVVIGRDQNDAQDKIYFVSSNSIHYVSLQSIFESNVNLKEKEPETYYKSKKHDRWTLFSGPAEKDTDEGRHKSHRYGKIDLKNLREHAVLIYPKVLRDNFEKAFEGVGKSAVALKK
jgi:hypothetical protein